jgi:antirestriction protein ArdC
VLQNDKRAIFIAAAHAQKAADYLHGFQIGSDAEKEDSVARACA